MNFPDSTQAQAKIFTPDATLFPARVPSNISPITMQTLEKNFASQMMIALDSLLNFPSQLKLPISGSSLKIALVLLQTGDVGKRLPATLQVMFSLSYALASFHTIFTDITQNSTFLLQHMLFDCDYFEGTMNSYWSEEILALPFSQFLSTTSAMK